MTSKGTVMFKTCFSLCVLIVISSNAAAVQAQSWGDLQGTILFDGAAPKQATTNTAGKDPTVCAAQTPILDESLVVNPQNMGIKNCIVFLKTTPTTVHPDLKIPAEKEIKFDNVNCVFEPHVLVVQTNQAVRGINSDGCAHNIRTAPFSDKNKAENPILSPNDKVGYAFKFAAAERFPTPVECNIHGWMKAYWHVVDHPYAAVTDAEGKFSIPKLPAGEHTFMVWQEKSGLTSRGGEKVTIVAGKMSELKVTIPAAKFAAKLP
jgi:plastocyanin